MPDATRFLLLAACVALGVGLSWQAPINAEASRRLLSPALAAALSMGLGLAIVLAFFAATARELPAARDLAAAPWWIWIGGVIGAAFMMGSIMLVPRTGATVFLLAVVLGQMVGAVVADGLGLWGLAQRPIPWTKIVGLALVLAGVIVAQLDR